MVSAQGGQLKKTVKHSAIYGFGTMLRRLTGLIMLPIYTRYMTPADYGVVELLSMAIEIVSILVGLRISQAMFRYYILEDNADEKRKIVSTVLFTVMVSSSFGAAILYMAAEPLTQLIFGSADYLFEFQLFALTLLTNAITAAGLSYLRARQVPMLFLAINIASLILQVCLNIYFVVMLELHVTGVVYSALISGIVISTGLFVYVLSQTGIHYSVSIAIKLIKFVSPLMLASLGAFYVAYADKYFLRVFGNLTDVGLYALAARVSSVLATIFEAFNMSWGADRFEVLKKENARYIYDQVFRFLSVVLFLIGAAMAMFANDFFRLMTSPEFYPASYVVPILIVAALSRIYMIFSNLGALYGERTGIMATASWIKVFVATVCYLLLIPYFGIYGAATALMLSSFIELCWVYKQSAKIYDMELQLRPVLMMFAVTVACVISGLLLPEGEITWFASRVCLFLLLIFVLYKMPVWTLEEKNSVSLFLAGNAKLIKRKLTNR